MIDTSAEITDIIPIGDNLFTVNIVLTLDKDEILELLEKNYGDNMLIGVKI